MGYYAMVVPAYTGHLNPMTVLGRAVQRRGHRVVCVAPPDAESKILKAGLEFIPVGAREFPPGEWENLTACLGTLTGLAASRFTGKWLAKLARGHLQDLPAIFEREKFDGVVMDQVAIGTESVCEVTRMPMALACNALMLHSEPTVPPWLFPWRYETSPAACVRNLLGYAINNLSGTPVIRQLIPYRRKHRLSMMRMDHINELPPSLVQVAQQPAFFDFPRRSLPDHFHYTGPWKEEAPEEGDDFPWQRLDGRPLIYASLGTLQNRLEEAFRTIAEACVGLDAQLVLALGSRTSTIPRNLPGDPVVVPYAPQQALLKRASLVITHGGLNTTLECLREGLPVVILPITNDQPGVAVRAERLGFGEFIPIKHLTTEKLRGLIERVMASESHRQRARDLSQEMRSVDGPARAAELIERALSTRQRVLR